MKVYLIPVGRERYDIYSDVTEEAAGQPEEAAGFVRRSLRVARAQWEAAVQAARHRGHASRGRFARWRDGVVHQLAERIAEQRTLWALRHHTAATVVHPVRLDRPRAFAILNETLVRARRRHRGWLAVHAAGFVASGLLMPLPGPNLVAFYFAFRLTGHYLSWRGAQQGLGAMAWEADSHPALDELAELLDLPAEDRAARVHAIAERLSLPRLAAFLERVAPDGREPRAILEKPSGR